MVGTSEGGAREVADALSTTCERVDADGLPWCPVADGQRLSRWIIDRRRDLGTGIRRAVRLARLAAVADGQSYVRFIYVTLPRLRGGLIRDALHLAATEGRLAPPEFTLSSTGATMIEASPETRPHPAAFEISYSQMPMLCALLDFLHNALGFTVVAETLAPVLGDTNGDATSVARRLHARIGTWLAARLQSQHHAKQARAMRAFLGARGPVTADGITDETILAFWQAMAAADEPARVDGFARYTSVARALLLYREALRDAAAQAALARAEALGDANAWSSGSAGEARNAVPDSDEWRSPIATLTVPPCDGVKWLTKAELRRLGSYLGGPAEGDTVEDGEHLPSAAASGFRYGLMGQRRFDLAFLLTLFRVEVFGPLQAATIAAVRRGSGGEEAVEQALGTVSGTAYTDLAATYERIADQLRLELEAAGFLLMRGGRSEAIALIAALAGPSAVDDLATRAGISASQVAAVRRALSDGAADGELDEFHLEAQQLIATIAASLPALEDVTSNRQTSTTLDEIVAATERARRRVHRQGFPRASEIDPLALDVLAKGALAAIATRDEITRLCHAIRRRTGLSEQFTDDRAAFAATLCRLYTQ